MNERLKELAKQAKVEHCISHRRLEEFAALIVNDCAGIVSGSSLPDAYSEPVLDEIADEMREWFGVSK